MMTMICVKRKHILYCNMYDQTSLQHAGKLRKSRWTEVKRNSKHPLVSNIWSVLPVAMSMVRQCTAAAISTAADVAVVRYYCCCCCCKCINLIIFFKFPYCWSNFHNFCQIFIILVKLPQFWSNFLNFGQISTILVKFPQF